MKFVESIRAALQQAMTEDDSVVLLGEDIGIDGGVFRATDGLVEQFGEQRVIDTPLAEASIAGVATGLATQGVRAVAEIQFMGFAYTCLDQLINHASRLRNRTRGRLSCPLVMRIPYGGGIRAPEHHSESGEALFCHVPGLRVVVPSSPSRAYGLLLSAVRDPDPVIFLEPKRLYQVSEEGANETSDALPLDQAVVLAEGDQLTLLCWGAMVPLVLDAADVLRAEGINADVIDVCCLSLLDMTTIGASVEKTGRCVIVHEAPRNAGFGAEISARLAEEYVLSLRAPLLRVTGYDTVMPLAKTESYYLPSSDSIVESARSVMAFA